MRVLMTKLPRLLTSLTHLGSRWVCVLFVKWFKPSFVFWFFLCVEILLGQKLMKSLVDAFRSNLHLTRSSFLHRLRNLSRICRRNLMRTRRNILERTLREQPSSCFQKSRTCNCKFLLIDWCSHPLFASMWTLLGFRSTQFVFVNSCCMAFMIFTRLRLSCSFVGESMHDDGCLVFAYYKEGATDPTFLYFAPSLKEVKCWRVPIAGLDVQVLALLVLVLSLNALLSFVLVDLRICASYFGLIVVCKPLQVR